MMSFNKAIFTITLLFFGGLQASSDVEDLKNQRDLLTNLASRQKAIDLYEKYQNPPKPKRKKKDLRTKSLNHQSPLNDLEQSAQLGYIPALIASANQTLSSLRQDAEALSKKREALEDKLGDTKNMTSILETYSIYDNQFQLEFDWINDIESHLDHLNQQKNQGELFYYGYGFLQQNGLELLVWFNDDDSFTNKAISVPSLEKSTASFSQHFNSLKFFKKAYENLKRELENIRVIDRTNEVKELVKKVQKIFNAYCLKTDDCVEKIEPGLFKAQSFDFSSKKITDDFLKKLDNYQLSFSYQIRDLNTQYGDLSREIRSILTLYSDKQYAISPTVFNDLKIITKKITSILCCYCLDFENYDHDEGFLYSLALSYITSHEKVPCETRSLKERVRLLKEAQNYLNILTSDPEKFLKITCPRRYEYIKNKPDFRALVLQDRTRSGTGVGEPKFSESLAYLSNCVQTRLLKYALWYVNEQHPSYSLTLKNSATHRHLKTFLQVSELALRKFRTQSFDKCALEMDMSGVFYKYVGKKQNIWTHKSYPFFIRISQEEGQWIYRIGFLKDHPYDRNGTFKVINYDKNTRILLITDRNNELFKFSFLSEVIIPSTAKRDQAQLWRTNDWDQNNSLMKGAHGTFIKQRSGIMTPINWTGV